MPICGGPGPNGGYQPRSADDPPGSTRIARGHPAAGRQPPKGELSCGKRQYKRERPTSGTMSTGSSENAAKSPIFPGGRPRRLRRCRRHLKLAGIKTPDISILDDRFLQDPSGTARTGGPAAQAPPELPADELTAGRQRTSPRRRASERCWRTPSGATTNASSTPRRVVQAMVQIRQASLDAPLRR